MAISWPLPFALGIKHGETRCHTYLSDIAIFMCLSYAGLEKELAKKGFPEPFIATFACMAANMDLHLICNGHLKAAVSGEPPDELVVQIEAREPEPEAYPMRGVKDLNTRIVCAMFSLFADRAGEWVRENVASDPRRWPPVANFCRVVRNAIVHGGTINVNSPAAPVVSWRGLTYSHQDKGREIVNTGDLSTGDLILLMIELELELNELGAPFALG